MLLISHGKHGGKMEISKNGLINLSPNKTISTKLLEKIETPTAI